MLDRQIQPDPPSRQPHSLLLVHLHAGVISLQQRSIHPLGPGILDKLLGLLNALDQSIPVPLELLSCVGGEILADMELQWRRIGERAAGELAEDGPVERADSGRQSFGHDNLLGSAGVGRGRSRTAVFEAAQSTFGR